MRPTLTLVELLALLGEEPAFVEMLQAEGLLRSPLEREYSEEEADEARVARLLLRELEVNMAGVAVILHMRRQMLALRGQVLEVLQQVAVGRRDSG